MHAKITAKASELSLHHRPSALLFILVITVTLDPRPAPQPLGGRRRPPHGDALLDQLADFAGAVHAVEGVAHGGGDGGEAGAAVIWAAIQQDSA